MMKSLTCALVLVGLSVAGCHEHSHSEDADELPGGSVTLWSPKTELFMEHPALLVGVPAKFLVHLTVLSNTGEDAAPVYPV